MIESPRYGRFYPEKAEEYEVPRGHLWGKMQKGNSVTLEDGRIIDPIETGIVGPLRSGSVIVYSGDTTIFPNLTNIAKDADYFICECTYGEEHHEQAVEKRHMTAKMAATVAKEAQVGTLILTHFSNRYKYTDTLLKEAKEIFKDTQCTEDLQEIIIKR